MSKPASPKPAPSLTQERSVLAELLNRQMHRIAALEAELAGHMARLDAMLAERGGCQTTGKAL